MGRVLGFNGLVVKANGQWGGGGVGNRTRQQLVVVFSVDRSWGWWRGMRPVTKAGVHKGKAWKQKFLEYQKIQHFCNHKKLTGKSKRIF